MNESRDRPKDLLGGEVSAWVVTGVAGFIGSHLLQTLLAQGQRVVGIDNFSTGSQANLDDVAQKVGAEAWRNFRLLPCDVRNEAELTEACRGADYVLHQAAISSVQYSLEHPAETFSNNVAGTQCVFSAAARAGVRRVVYASSAAVYGNQTEMPIRESTSPSPISLYGLTKQFNEETARFYSARGLSAVGLRYFNVYGTRQNPASPYSGVISIFAHAFAEGLPITIFGDGENSRDFVHVSDIARTNLLVANSTQPSAGVGIYNVGTGRATTLNDLVAGLRELNPESKTKVSYQPGREGDIRHSVADVSRLEQLGIRPAASMARGLSELCGR